MGSHGMLEGEPLLTQVAAVAIDSLVGGCVDFQVLSVGELLVANCAGVAGLLEWKMMCNKK